ncbi:hypothetical protein ACFY9N_03945 [Microbacterium sp. NPDC008134]|uniref:hypothetical protein n=1 Tax=Microbacterium sp. NPDC008134 TaxID=3364183 RepID=UPI0036E215DB
MFTKAKRKAGIAAGLALIAVLGGGMAASAATAGSSISSWSVGSTGSWRKATSNSIAQTFTFNTYCQWGNGAILPTYAQMQLQRENGILAPISQGNRDLNCSGSGSGNWGGQVQGVQYRYQYNGVKVPNQTGLKNGLFSVSSVTIQY